MNYEELKSYEKKEVKILLKNRFIYNCFLERVNEDCIFFIDKYGNDVSISLDEISMISLNNKNNRGNNGEEKT